MATGSLHPEVHVPTVKSSADPEAEANTSPFKLRDQLVSYRKLPCVNSNVLHALVST